MPELDVDQREQKRLPAADVLQLHLAEYNALTTRNTYILTIQYGLPAILLLFVTLVYTFRGKRGQVLGMQIWAAFIGAQIIGLVWAENLWEQYNNLKYIEEHLRPAVTSLVHDPSFWCYEPYRATERRTSWWSPEWATCSIGGILLVGILLCRLWPSRGTLRVKHIRQTLRSNWIDVAGLVISFGLLIALTNMMSNAVHASHAIKPLTCP